MGPSREGISELDCDVRGECVQQARCRPRPIGPSCDGPL